MIVVLFVIVALLTPARAQNADSSSANVSTTLARAHWCRTYNGSYLPLDYSYMQSVCTICRCTPSHSIQCAMIQCMPTYCLDNSAPIRVNGECCTRCASDMRPHNGSVPGCVYNNITFPHGSMIKSVQNQMNCWCQLGNIECRSYAIGMGQPMDLLSDTTAIYIVIMVIFIVLVVGMLLCCSCTLFLYYYYQKYQQTLEQEYAEYVNSAGWQPMGDEENGVNMTAEEKRLEAEKIQGVTGVLESIPPAYADYHN